MNWDFWNNPLVVSALRIRYRRGGFTSWMVTYFLVLVAGSAVLFYYRDRTNGPFPRNLLLGVLGIQFLISFMMASTATSQSLHKEVINRTFDFQRIAALSPFQILLGKLLGEAMVPFFSIIPTIPLAVFCCFGLGVEGMDFLSLLLMYVTLLTTTFLSGATGLLQPLDIDPSGKVKPANNMGAVLFGSFFCSVPALVGGGVSILATPWSAALLGLLTPIPTYEGIYFGDPWQFRMFFYDLRVPFLLVTPVSQLVLAGIIIHAMRRRLINPLRTILSRPVTYLMLFGFDLLLGGVIYDAVPPLGKGLYTRTAAFWLAHMVFAFLLLNLVTPGREALLSWSWRFRGRISWIRDGLLGERSANTLVLLVMACLGVVDYFSMVFLPAKSLFSVYDMIQFRSDALLITLTSTLLFLAAGSLLQCIVVFERGKRMWFFSMFVLLILPLDLAGRYFQIDALLGLTPSGHFGRWLNESPSQGLYEMFVLYSIVLVVTQVLTHSRIAVMNRTVDEKIRQMKAEPVRLAGEPA